jgi:hypothetical protein
MWGIGLTLLCDGPPTGLHQRHALGGSALVTGMALDQLVVRFFVHGARNRAIQRLKRELAPSRSNDAPAHPSLLNRAG